MNGRRLVSSRNQQSTPRTKSERTDEEPEETDPRQRTAQRRVVETCAEPRAELRPEGDECEEEDEEGGEAERDGYEARRRRCGRGDEARGVRREDGEVCVAAVSSVRGGISRGGAGRTEGWR